MRSVVAAWIFTTMLDASDKDTGCMPTREHQQIATRDGIAKLLCQQSHFICSHRSLNLHLEQEITSQMLQKTLNMRRGYGSGRHKGSIQDPQRRARLEPNQNGDDLHVIAKA